MPSDIPPRRLPLMAAFVICAVVAPAVQAFDFQGNKALVAVAADGQRLSIGSVSFQPEGTSSGGKVRFKTTLNPKAFTDYFLSMREFKCLPAAREVTCQVPYPYAHPATVTPDNLAWLEHSLLFLTKSPAEFGAKLWNGVYFKFSVRGDALVGSPMAVDLNEISAPPDDPTVPPFGPDHRQDMPAGARWITELRIE